MTDTDDLIQRMYDAARNFDAVCDMLIEMSLEDTSEAKEAAELAVRDVFQSRRDGL